MPVYIISAEPSKQVPGRHPQSTKTWPASYSKDIIFTEKDGTKATAVEVIIDRIENLSPKDAATTSANEGFSIQENENQPLSYSDDDLPF